MRIFGIQDDETQTRNPVISSSSRVCVYTHTHTLLFKGLSMIGILNLDAQNTLKFICLYSLNNRIRYVKLVI